MTIGILVITHAYVGQALVDAATKTLGVCPLATEVLPVGLDCEPSDMVERAKEYISRLDSGSGVLVLTDLFGSTPSNVACQLLKPGSVEVVSGINLPMIIRTLNYPGLTLAELREKAISGGKDGVLCCVEAYS